MTQIQVGTETIDTDRLAEHFDNDGNRLTQNILRAHDLVNGAIGRGNYQPYVPAMTSGDARTVSRNAQVAALKATLRANIDLGLTAMELFERGDCDDVVIGVLAGMSVVEERSIRLVQRGMSEEQQAANSDTLEASMRALVDGGEITEASFPMAYLGREITGPILSGSLTDSIMYAINAQMQEQGGCGDPQCVACSGAATADEPIDGDTTIADLESRADSGEAVEEQGE